MDKFRHALMVALLPFLLNLVFLAIAKGQQSLPTWELEQATIELLEPGDSAVFAVTSNRDDADEGRLTVCFLVRREVGGDWLDLVLCDDLVGPLVKGVRSVFGPVRRNMNTRNLFSLELHGSKAVWSGRALAREKVSADSAEEGEQGF